jgi:hypothetical protein
VALFFICLDRALGSPRHGPKNRFMIARFKERERRDFQQKMSDLRSLAALLRKAGQPVPTPLTFLEPQVCKLLLFYDPRSDLPNLEALAILLLDSCCQTRPEVSTRGDGHSFSLRWRSPPDFRVLCPRTTISRCACVKGTCIASRRPA